MNTFTAVSTPKPWWKKLFRKEVIAGVVLLLLMVGGSAAWWLANQEQTTDSRSQANVDQSPRILLEKITRPGELETYAVYLDARSVPKDLTLTKLGFNTVLSTPMMMKESVLGCQTGVSLVSINTSDSRNASCAPNSGQAVTIGCIDGSLHKLGSDQCFDVSVWQSMAVGLCEKYPLCTPDAPTPTQLPQPTSVPVQPPLPGPTSVPVPSPSLQPIPGEACIKAGCNGELCLPKSEAAKTSTICLYKPEYACYEQAVCQRQASGECGFTMTAQLKACLAEGGVPASPVPPQPTQLPQPTSVPVDVRSPLAITEGIRLYESTTPGVLSITTSSITRAFRDSSDPHYIVNFQANINNPQSPEQATLLRSGQLKIAEIVLSPEQSYLMPQLQSVSVKGISSSGVEIELTRPLSSPQPVQPPQPTAMPQPTTPPPVTGPGQPVPSPSVRPSGMPVKPFPSVTPEPRSNGWRIRLPGLPGGTGR